MDSANQQLVMSTANFSRDNPYPNNAGNNEGCLKLCAGNSPTFTKNACICDKSQACSRQCISGLSDEDYFLLTKRSVTSFTSPSRFRDCISVVDNQIVAIPHSQSNVVEASQSVVLGKKTNDVDSEENGVSKRRKSSGSATQICICNLECPFFELTMKKSHVVHGFSLAITKEFSKKYFPPQDFYLKLEDEHGKCWKVKYLARKNDFSAGWRQFAIDKGLAMEDKLVFFMLSVRRFKVLILSHDLSEEANEEFMRRFFLKKQLFFAYSSCVEARV